MTLILRIQLLDEFRLLMDGRLPISLNKPRQQALLAYLLLHRHAPQPRQQVAFCFWPDSTEGQAYTNLRKLYFQLRQALPQADCFLVADSQTIGWDATAPYTLDVAELDEALDHLEASETPDLALVEQVMKLYRGELLPNCFDDWILPLRRSLHERVVNTLEKAIDGLEVQQEYEAGLRCAEHLLRLDPLHELTYRRLIRLRALKGDRAGALRVYHECVNVLQRELAVEPSAETQHAYKQVLKQEVSAPAQATEPTPAALPKGPHSNLPADLTPFIGREQEVAAVRALLQRAEVRLVTLTGPGGTGKTRLGLTVAAKLLDEFNDGVFFVSLGRITDPTLVVSTISQVLGLHEAGDRPLMETLHDYLRDKQLLLVLDNFEQLLSAASLVTAILTAARALKVIVTSRAPLRVQGEREYAVPPLAVPDPQQRSNVNALAQYEAVRLFIQRAQDVKTDFVVTGENAQTVAEICARLDGLPLAIELAAARSKLLTPQALLQRLSSRLQLLTSGARDLPARQQTLRNSIDWSYRLLEPAEQILLSRLVVFVGGCTLEAAESVCNANGDLDGAVFERIASLLDKNLLRREDGPEGEPRFGMLETIREYALERLEESGEGETLRRQHAAYFVAHTRALTPDTHHVDYKSRLERLAWEHDNVRAALQWSIDHREAEMCVRFAETLWGFWFVRGFITEGRRWLEAILEVCQVLPPAMREPALVGAGELARAQGDYPSAQLLHQECLAIHQELGNKRGIARSFHDLAQVAMAQGDLQQALELSEESVRLRRELGAKAGINHALNALGEVLRFLGEYPRARQVHEECLAMARELGNLEAIYIALCSLGHIARRQQEYTQAVLWLQEGLILASDVGDRQNTAYLLEELAGVALGQGAADRAVRLWAATASEREAINCPLMPHERAAYELDYANARDQLDVLTWERAWAADSVMTLEQAVAYALST
jgi:predicted ATPase/DNA-binding SARP family transcriptional activator